MSERCLQKKNKKQKRKKKEKNFFYVLFFCRKFSDFLLPGNFLLPKTQNGCEKFQFMGQFKIDLFVIKLTQVGKTGSIAKKFFFARNSDI